MSRGITHQEAMALYGAIQGGVWADEAKHMVLQPIDPSLPWVNALTGGPVQHIYMNRDVVAPFAQAVALLISTGCVSELETFDGCFHIRDVRGVPGSPSAHSYGLAIDINAKANPLNGPLTFSAQFVQCFIEAGFDWGGNFHRLDGMHFSYAWEG